MCLSGITHGTEIAVYGTYVVVYGTSYELHGTEYVKSGTEDKMLDYLFVLGLVIIFILYVVIIDHICNGSDKSDRN